MAPTGAGCGISSTHRLGMWEVNNLWLYGFPIFLATMAAAGLVKGCSAKCHRQGPFLPTTATAMGVFTFSPMTVQILLRRHGVQVSSPPPQQRIRGGPRRRQLIFTKSSKMIGILRLQRKILARHAKINCCKGVLKTQKESFRIYKVPYSSFSFQVNVLITTT